MVVSHFLLFLKGLFYWAFIGKGYKGREMKLTQLTSLAQPNRLAESKNKPQWVLDFRNYSRHWYLVLLFIPGILWFVVFRYIPIYGLTLAFRDFSFRAGILGSEWVGLAHFRWLFSLPGFWDVFRNTVIINFYQLFFGFPAPIIFAIFLNEITHLRFKKLAQTISYLPHFLSWVILAGMMVQILSPSTGMVNFLLRAIGMDPIFFLGDPRYFRGVLVFSSIWRSIGWSSIIYLAALSSVNVEMYEAARIDGAKKLQEIWYITLPSISNVITIMLILRAGTLLADNFDQIFNLLNPAVFEVGDVLATYTFRLGIRNMEFSMATAVGLFTNVISFTLVILINAVSKKFNDYGIW